MGGTMRRPAEQILRFTRAERWTHRATAVLFGVVLASAACLYVPALSELVGRRRLVETVHVYAGYLLPLPALLAVMSVAFRRDARRLNRFDTADWRWLRSRDRRSGRVPVGKFNAGQKLNAAFVVGAVLVMLGTGLLMRYPSLVDVGLRTGATFTHDWLALAVAVVLTGHVWKAARDPMARRGMRQGWVSVAWARREHGRWVLEEGEQASTDSAGSRGAPAGDATAGSGPSSQEPAAAVAADEPETTVDLTPTTDPSPSGSQQPGLPFFPRPPEARPVPEDQRGMTERLPRFPSS